jgi:aminoglycoside 3-N-acetyltransferase
MAQGNHVLFIKEWKVKMNSYPDKKISLEDLVVFFKKLGLSPGSTVLVHSDLRALIRSLDVAKIKDAPRVLYEAMIQVLGKEGTLIIPTFNFDFCKGVSFDVRNTKSQMGIFTEYVRNLKESRRVLHPIYSFSIVGRLADELGGLRYKSSYGRDSVFGKLRDLDGKIMIINLPYNHSMTFFHHVEEMEGCTYRYFKEFKGKITDHEGRTYEDTFIMLVRDLDKGVMTQVEPMGKVLEEQGVVNIEKLGKAVFKLVSANDVYRITAQKMKEDPYLLYQIEKKS